MAGKTGELRNVAPGIGDDAQLGRNRKLEDYKGNTFGCLYGPLLSGGENMYVIGETGNVGQTFTGKMQMVSEGYLVGDDEFLNLYTVQAAKVLKMEKATGNVSVMFDFCANGFFTKKSWDPPKEGDLGKGGWCLNPGGTCGAVLGVGGGSVIGEGSNRKVRVLVFMQGRYDCNDRGQGCSSVESLVAVDITSQGTTVSNFKPLGGNWNIQDKGHPERKTYGGPSAMTTSVHHGTLHVFVSISSFMMGSGCWQLEQKRYGSFRESSIYHTDGTNLVCETGEEHFKRHLQLSASFTGSKCDLQFTPLVQNKPRGVLSLAAVISSNSLHLYAAEFRVWESGANQKAFNGISGQNETVSGVLYHVVP